MQETTPLGRELRRRRKDAGMTQEDLAEATGLERSYVARIESGGVATLSEERATTMAKAIGINIDELRRLAEQSQSEYRLPCAGLTNQHRAVGATIEESWERLSDVELEQIVEAIRDSVPVAVRPEPTAFGRMLQEKRLARQLSQRVVAHAIGVARSYVSMVEGGSELCLPGSSIPALASILGVDKQTLEGLILPNNTHVLRMRGCSDAARAAAFALQERWTTMGRESLSRIETIITRHVTTLVDN